jgi:uncharacterized protein HemX
MSHYNNEEILSSFDGMRRATTAAPFEQIWKAMQQDSGKARIITLWIYRAAVVLVLLAGANLFSYWQKQQRYKQNETSAIERFADEYGFTQND